MKLLIAEDELTMRTILKKHASTFGYEIVLAEDGDQALNLLSHPEGPRLALLDWMMAARDGVDVCRLIKKEYEVQQYYLIILTTRSQPEDIEHALGAGADDYIVKPYSPIELQARLGVGRRVLEANAKVRRLEGLLPICAACHKIRDGSDYWHRVEAYISSHSDASFTHSICPECMARLYPDYVRNRDRNTGEPDQCES